MRRSVWYAWLSVAWTFLLPANVSAAVFCNMDRAGGGGAASTQSLAATAAAAVLQAASTTFSMMAEIEQLLAGKIDSLRSAPAWAKQSMAQLTEAQRQFMAASDRHEQGIVVVNQGLSRMRETDYERVFAEERLFPNGSVAKDLRARKDVRQLFLACAQSIGDLLDRRQPMARVYAQVSGAQKPSAEDVRASTRQWTEALSLGRVISAIFTAVPR